MANEIKLSFGPETEGTLENKNHKVAVSYSGQGFAPYELFLGGYASCLHATFGGIMRKRKLEYSHVDYQVVGHKREEVPTYLEKLITNITIFGADEDKQEKVIKSMEQAEKYCSISHTIANLDCEMIFHIEFK